MVAKVADMNVEAAASFAHAISTHRVSNEVEFFTALDDLPGEDARSAHMGSLEFNSRLPIRSEEHTSELQSRGHLVCRLLLEKNTGGPSRRRPPKRQCRRPTTGRVRTGL